MIKKSCIILVWKQSKKGYGFIENDAGGKDVFLHISALEEAGIDKENYNNSNFIFINY